MMKKVIRSFILACAFFGFVFPLGTAYPATTTKITVNSFFDVVDSGDNSCTLREAIIAANRNLPSGLVKGECPAGNMIGADTIVVPPGG